MGWILFLNEDEKPCAWPDGSTTVGVTNDDEVVMTCGEMVSLPAESPEHTNDWQRVLDWVEGSVPSVNEDIDDVMEPGFDDDEDE